MTECPSHTIHTIPNPIHSLYPSSTSTSTFSFSSHLSFPFPFSSSLFPPQILFLLPRNSFTP